MSDKARTVSERAVRKASGERLLRDMSAACGLLEWTTGGAQPTREQREVYIVAARSETSRTRYACLMTAFGQ